MLSELEFSMKKIHIARNMGLVPKNDDISDKQNVSAWDTGEPSALGSHVLVCSDKVVSSPRDPMLSGHEDALLPEYIKRVLHSVIHMEKNGIHNKNNLDIDTAEHNYKHLVSTAGKVTNSTMCGASSKSPVNDEEVLLLDAEPCGIRELGNGKEPEIANSAVESDLLDTPHAQDQDNSCSERGKLVGVCRVCGDHATGMYFGALVCVPCKTFFLRYANDGNSFVCKADGNCQISTATRTQCKFCRYQKCMQAGMRRRVRPAQVKLNEGQQLCVVCSDVGNGVHFGALTCEGCKKFFRRGLSENGQYTCKNNNDCIINPQTRNSCRCCRYQKCLRAGMCREAIQMGRPSKIPSSSGGRNSTDRRHLIPRPVNRNADSSNKAEDSPLVESVQVQNLSQSVNLPQPESWMNSTLIDQLHWQYDRRLSLSSEESQHDLENSEEQVQGRKVLSSRLNSLNSDSTQQPDSTVLSPAETNILDEPEESFVPPDNPLASRSLQTKGPPALLPCGIKSSLGRRANVYGEDKQQTQEKRKRTTLVESDVCSSKVPGQLQMQPYNGRQVDGKNNLDLEAKQPEVNCATNGLSARTSLMTLPLLKENGLNVTKSVDCTAGGRAVVSCSSPSVTSSLSSDAVRKQKTEQGPINSSVGRSVKIGDSVVDNTFSKKFDLECLVEKSRTYWLQPCLPDPNILFAGAKHWDVLNSIVPSYDRFLQMSNAINRTLKTEFEEWSRQVTDSIDKQTFLSEWIKHKVIPAYTIASVTYCKSLPGFSSFHCDDQRTIIRLGQSPSRILMAALNWYDADQKNFRNFLSWRDKKVGQLDLFKQKLIEYAEDITSLEVDAIEAALLNVLLILATDYPDLVQTDVISDARWKILSTFRAYTTGKCGTPNNRVESLFSHMPELRRLGLLHHMMMTTRTMTAEEVEYLTSGRTLDSKMVLSCQPSTDS